MLVLPYGTASLWEAEEAEDGAGESWDGPGEFQMFHINCAEAAVTSLYLSSLSLFHLFQGEYEFSPEILSGKLAEVVYRDAAGKIQGWKFKILCTLLKVKLSVLA